VLQELGLQGPEDSPASRVLLEGKKYSVVG
jgi:hypothetical protein